MRLIDADALKENLRGATIKTSLSESEIDLPTMFGLVCDMVDECIDNAPTIEPSGDLISRADAIEGVCGVCIYTDRCEWKNVGCDYIQTLETLPTSVRPKGEWIDNDTFVHKAFNCSRCGHITSIKTPFCSNCGAEMRGDE